MASQVTESSGLATSWTRVRDRLRSEYGDVAFENWLNRLDLGNLSGDSLVLSAPSRFMRDWVAPRYGDRIRALWRLEDPSVKQVDIIVKERGVDETVGQSAKDLGEMAAPGTVRRSPDDDVADALLDPKLTFENFVVWKPIVQRITYPS